MRAAYVYRAFLLPAILTWGILMGCSAPKDSHATCSAEPCDDMPSKKSNFPFQEYDVPHTYCPYGKFIIKGRIDDAPYELMTDAGIDLIPSTAGYVEVDFMNGDDFIWMFGLEAFYGDTEAFVSGLAKFPNLPDFRRILPGSRMYVGPDYAYVDFRLLTWSYGKMGDLTGCIDGLSKPPQPSP